MNSLTVGFIGNQPISQDLITSIRVIGEFKGKQELFKQQSPQVLKTLRQTSIIQSAESSNRLEGITAPQARIRELVAEKTTPRNRSEQEIAGYRDVLQTIHARHADIPFTANVVRQLHRDLFQFLPSEGGVWKHTDNDITETLPDGTVFVRFSPVKAHLTATHMQGLHERYTSIREQNAVEPLLLIASYVFDFLCIHPFIDGNGRMARLITLLLLYHEGYEVGRYISLEHIIEQTKEGYYDVLYRSSQGWHEGAHSLIPWWEYFLGVVLLQAYREFEDRAGIITGGRGGKSAMVKDVIARLPQHFQFADVQNAAPGVSRPTINRVLRELREAGRIRCPKGGRDAVWEKIEHHHD